MGRCYNEINNFKMVSDDMDKLPKRKNIRLNNYDYSQAGYYLITICTKDKKSLLWDVGATFGRPELGYQLILSRYC